MEDDSTLYVGLDVHKDSITVAYALGAGEVELLGKIGTTKTPRKPGERVKTDRRDAIKLVRSLRAGDLSAVYVPSIEDEAFRDLARAWVSTKDDLKRARQRLKAFLLSHGVRYTGRADWGPAHRRWLSTYAFDSAWQQMAFEEHRRTIEDRLAQCDRLEAALREAVVNWRFYPAVLGLQTMRGVQFNHRGGHARRAGC
jgi:transposase